VNEANGFVLDLKHRRANGDDVPSVELSFVIYTLLNDLERTLPFSNSALSKNGLNTAYREI
jgi:hypothetical protein